MHILANKKNSFWNRILEGFSAVAFAEAGEFEYAKKIVKDAGLEPKKELTYLEKAMAAVAFAEAGEFEYAKEWIEQKESEVEVRSRHLDRLLEVSIETAAATAFAEVGEHYQAIQILGRLRGKKVLVVCEGEELPDRLMKQGIELAEKMDLELIVLNIFMQTVDSAPSLQRKKWREELVERAEKGLKKWKDNHPHIKIDQIVEFGDPLNILQDVLLKTQGVRYILSLKDLFRDKEALSKVFFPSTVENFS